jgi:hypothetical protein
VELSLLWVFATFLSTWTTLFRAAADAGQPFGPAETQTLLIYNTYAILLLLTVAGVGMAYYAGKVFMPHPPIYRRLWGDSA